jgi:hypothetical protein
MLVMGTSLKAGLDITFFLNTLYSRRIKGGYINMQNIRTTNSAEDSASRLFSSFNVFLSEENSGFKFLKYII